MIRLALLAILLGAIAFLLLAGVWRSREARKPPVWLELLPPQDAALDLSGWRDLYQALYAIVPPSLKRLFLGMPWLSFEFWATEDGVRALCWLPARVRTVVTTQLQAALPGLEIREAEADGELPAVAARSRLRLYRDPLYPLGNPRPEPLVAVVNTLARARHGVVQLVVQPDIGWQNQALHRLDVLGGLSPAPLTLKSFLTAALDFVSDLVLPSSGGGTATKPKPSHANRLPPAEKATQPGYRAELRLRISASTKNEAKALVHSLVAAFRRFDGANGLRPKRVWMGWLFDRTLSSRKPPRRCADTLVIDELASLFHLPIAGEAINAAPVRVTPPRLKPDGDKVIVESEESEAC